MIFLLWLWLEGVTAMKRDIGASTNPPYTPKTAPALSSISMKQQYSIKQRLTAIIGAILFTFACGSAAGPAYQQLTMLLPGEPAAQSGMPAPQVAGTPFYITINAVDGNGNVVLQASPTVQMVAPNDPNFALPQNSSGSVTLMNGTAGTGLVMDSSGNLYEGDLLGRVRHFASRRPGDEF
jgi:hypothetical protein